MWPGEYFPKCVPLETLWCVCMCACVYERVCVCGVVYKAMLRPASHVIPQALSILDF